MKTIRPLFLLLFIGLVTQKLSSQTLVNTFWTDTAGSPTLKNSFVTGESDEAGNTIIIYDTHGSAYPDRFLITKYDSLGNTIWATIYTDPYSRPVFGTNLYCTGSDIYIAGIVFDDSTETTGNFLYLRMDADGDIIWWDEYDGDYGGTNIPSAIYADNSTGFLYIAGTEQTDSFSSEFTILKFDTGDNEIWTSHWDTGSFYNVPARMFVSDTQIVLVGGSGVGPTSYASALVTLDPGSGSIIDSRVDSSGYGYFNQIVGVEEDKYGNIYVAGTVDSAGISMVSLNKLVSYPWTQTWLAPGSLSTVSTAMTIDPITGFIAISATSTKPNGGQDAITLAYQTSGALQWAQTVSAPNPALIAQANDIAIDENDNVYIAGTITKGTHLNYLTHSYAADGTLRWLKTYSRCSSCNDIAQTIMLPPVTLIGPSGNVPVVSGISMNPTDTTYATIAYEQWQPASCDVPTIVQRSSPTCPTINYSFRNGQITTLGTDSFVEFDIYASQTTGGPPFSAGSVYFTYSTDIFGQNVVDSNKITVTRGVITADTNYVITLADTLFPSDAVPNNGSEVGISIYSLYDTDLYTIPDTAQQLCHVKMKLKAMGTLKIGFDKFFMEDQSYFTDAYSNLYNYVNTGGPMAITRSNAANLYYYLTDITTSNTTLSCNIWALTNTQVDMLDAAVRITYNPLSLNNPPNIDLSSSSYWVPDPTNVSGNGIYVSGNINSIGTYEFDVFQSNGDQAGIMHQWTSSGSASCSIAEPSGEIFFGLNFTGNCGVLPNITIDALNDEINNDYYDPIDSMLTNFNVTVCGSYNSYFCIDGIPNIASDNNFTLHVYPNPFTNLIIASFFLNERSDVKLSIENLIGQTVYITSFGNLAPGSFNEELNLQGGISSGVYILKLTVNNEISAARY